MRAFLPGILLFAAALSGCAGDPEGPLEEDDDDQRRSVGGGGEGNETQYDDVAIAQFTLDLVGQDTQEVDVVVPDNVTIARFTISSTDSTAAFSDLRVELSGCGVYSQGATSFSGGTVTLAQRLCNDAADGPAKLTISNVGYAQGPTFKLIGQVPKANETAPAP